MRSSGRWEGKSTERNANDGKSGLGCFREKFESLKNIQAISVICFKAPKKRIHGSKTLLSWDNGCLSAGAKESAVISKR